jgi:hypothetical protein
MAVLRRTVIVLLLLALLAVNVRGRAVMRMRQPHGRMWHMQVLYGNIKDEHGRTVTRETHPEEFRPRPMLAWYNHGWPYTVTMRSAHIGPHSALDPEIYPTSNPWPVDSAHVYSIHWEDLALNVLVGLVILAIGSAAVSAVSAFRQTRVKVESDE